MKTQPVRPGFYPSALTGFGFAAQIHADEHYSYHNSVGKLLISKIQPRPGSKVITQQTVSEATETQLQRAREHEDLLVGFEVDQLNANIWKRRKTSSRDAADSASPATRISQSAWRT